jgi:uncharacterized protein (TIGR04255 family)
MAEMEQAFPHLRNAPIVEAVIDFRARPNVIWDQERIAAVVRERLKEFPEVQPLRGWEQQFQTEPGKTIEGSTRDLGWIGMILKSTDNLRVAQIHREGVSYSRLKPYPNWSIFSREAVELWELYRELTGPLEISRIGVRYINRIDIPITGADLGKYFRQPPQSPPGVTIPFSHFVYSDVFSIVEMECSIRLVRTIQPPLPPVNTSPGLIVDIDVSTTKALPTDDDIVVQRLTEMRWWKNKIFFATITDNLQRQFS